MKHATIALLTSVLFLIQANSPIIAVEPEAGATPVDASTGWAVVALDVPLEPMPVGRETTVPFKVLHLGRADREVDGAIVVFTLRHIATGDAIAPVAHAAGGPGVYEVVFTLDQPGAWQWTASVYNVGSMNPQATILPVLIAFAGGTADRPLATPVATSVPGDPGSITIKDDQIAPWRLEVSLGLKVIFENDSSYPVVISIEEGGSFDEVGRLEPGSSVMWYSTTPGDYLFTIGPAPAFRVGTISVTGEP
ncbi:MAG: cupredoxin domain-containing protein [Chloroflexota bacterium]|nr:cupredoxin domain-containing protein [Chloroflexota bacterium]